MNINLSEKPILIIGGGPGGYKFALELRAKIPGQRIILIEKNKLGGACLHSGCIPSKQLHSIGKLEDYLKLLTKNKTILEKSIASELNAAQIELIQGEAQVLIKTPSEITVSVNGEAIETEYLVIASGSRPRTLKNYDSALNSESFFADDNIAKGFADRYCFVGGGYIGVELASMLAKHGKRVRILEAQDEILGFAETFVRDKLILELKRSGINIYTSYTGEINLDPGEELFVSIGRETVLPIITNEQSGTLASLAELETFIKKSPGLERKIFVLGDASEQIALAHYAYAQAKALADALSRSLAQDHIDLQAALRIDKAKIPSVIFSHPELAMIGADVQSIKSKYGDDTQDLIVAWASSAKARISGAERGFTKWIICKSKRKILACSMIGQGASDLISAAIPMVNLGLSLDEVRDWVYPHPTLGEIATPSL
jgi:dihydrolipoamide dehydrogenase